MKLESAGILIEMHPLNERDSIARIFSCDYGVMAGVMRGAQIAKKNRPLVGQVGQVVWNARLDSQLGVFHWDATRNMVAPIIGDCYRLAMTGAAFALLAELLPERENYGGLYIATMDMLTELATAVHPDEAYINWEIKFLKDIGYALDLRACAGCGTSENLKYLSPRTCRAVCANCAAPYIDRLYKLPMSLNLGRQLIQRICADQGVSAPAARLMLCDN